MPAPGFEWFVAWRHLRDPERRSWWPFIVGVSVLLLGAACLLAASRLHPSRPPGELFMAVPSLLAERLKTAGSILVGLGLTVSVLGIFCGLFTVFTGISIFGVFLGTGAPIIALSVMSGFENDLKSKIRGAKADVVVTVADDRPFTDWQAVREKIRGIPGVVASTPYLEAEVMVRSPANPAGVILKGIDPQSAPEVLDLARTLREGRIEDLAHPEKIPRAPSDIGPPSGWDPRRTPAGEPEAKILPGILLGRELYDKTLRVLVGSDVDVACPMCGVGPTGPIPRLRQFRVAGYFYSGMFEFDQKLVYVTLSEAQRFLGMPGEVTGIEIRTARPERARAVAADVARALGPGHEVRSWEETNKGLFMALRLEKIAMFIVLTFIVLVASFSIVSNLIMLVTEKGREIAILKSMGARDGALLRVFFAEGLYIGLVGMLVGAPLGIGICLLISRFGLPLDPDVYYIQSLPVVMRAGEIAAVAAAALALCCLATVYPALLASRMRPVDGLRYE